jgi:AraC-like DNA-binding protein
MHRTLLSLLVGLIGGLALHGQMLPIPFVELAVEVDGVLDEWLEEGWNRFDPKVARPECGNHLFYQWGYDEQHLYLAVKVVDGRVTQHEHHTGNPRLYFNDGIEVYLDPLGDSDSLMGIDDHQYILSASGDHVSFKGGDSWLIKVDSALVPKDTSTRLSIVNFAVQVQGTLNDNRDRDSGYTLEASWPWANLGVMPSQGLTIRFDLCVDDMDTLVPDLSVVDTLNNLFFSSVTGHDDFGFPAYWKTAQLSGGPSAYYRFKQRFSPWWWAFALGAAALLSPWIVTLIVRNRRLRQIPERNSATEQAVVQAASAAPATPSLPGWVERSREFVLSRLDDDLRPEALASELAVSERQLQRMFREVLDTTPHAFITLVKLERAAELLRGGETSVKEVAYAVGFTDPGYFARVFKKYYNQSPSQVAQRPFGDSPT